MVFESLWEAAQKGELLLVEGGMCRWHLRRDRVLVIREIIATVPSKGTAMLAQLKQVPGAVAVRAKCPADLSSNGWYERMGFLKTGVEVTKSGRKVNVWELRLT